MTDLRSKHPRILAVAPSTRGFGFAVLEGLDTLADWGVKSVTKDKNARCITKVDDLISQYIPELLVLEDSSTGRRSPRIRRLGISIVRLARSKNVKVVLFTQEQMREAFSQNGARTKQARAEFIAEKFPDELSFRLPPKRRPWMSEDYRMDIFDAVALGVMPPLVKKNQRSP